VELGRATDLKTMVNSKKKERKGNLKKTARSVDSARCQGRKLGEGGRNSAISTIFPKRKGRKMGVRYRISPTQRVWSSPTEE